MDLALRNLTLRLLAAVLASTALAGAQAPMTTALRLLPYDVPAGCERCVYLNTEGNLRDIELTPNNPSLRIRVPAAGRIALYEPPSAELTARLKAKLAAEGRPNAPVRYTPDQLTPVAEITFQAPAAQALAVLFPTGRSQPKLLGYAVADDLARFQPGSRRLFNLTQRTIGAKLGSRELVLKPYSTMDIGPIADGDRLVFVPAEIWWLQDGERRPLSASRWAHDPNQRTVVFIYEDPSEGRVRIQACSERTDIPEPGEAPAGLAAGFGSANRAPAARPGAVANKGAPAVAEVPKARPLTESEAAEKKARESVDSTNFTLPSL